MADVGLPDFETVQRCEDRSRASAPRLSQITGRGDQSVSASGASASAPRTVLGPERTSCAPSKSDDDISKSGVMK
jgi:hypothetical protein